MRNILFLLFISLSFSSYSQEDTSGENEKKSSIVPEYFKIPGYLKLNFGLSTLSDVDASMKIDALSTRSFDLYYSKPMFLSDNFSFNPGIGISSDKLSFKNDVILKNTTTNDGINQIVIDTLDFSPKKNSLKGTYIMVPLDFKYYFGSGKFDKGRFFVGIGGEIGLLLNSSTKVKNKVNNNMTHSKIKDDFGLNQLKYGVSLQVGSGNFNLYYKMNLSELFEKNNLPLNIDKNPTLNKIGISFSIF